MNLPFSCFCPILFYILEYMSFRHTNLEWFYVSDDLNLLSLFFLIIFDNAFCFEAYLDNNITTPASL